MIYASTRCGELPELRSLRDLFKHHFGQPFDKTNIELLPGNRVNMQIKKNLSREPIMEDVMLQLTNDIANEYATSLDPQFKVQPCRYLRHRFLLLSDLN
ncbi:unnamed protein product [Cuscuta epithymum]|uniref:Uncharacterized protein n=1 Tax=Cuscuta epithymum TaxID=186058 RepID=A0AAV0GBL3_9ASTE|nr:unnamed protein product [Cuscuta epithymum]